MKNILLSLLFFLLSDLSVYSQPKINQKSDSTFNKKDSLKSDLASQTLPFSGNVADATLLPNGKVVILSGDHVVRLDVDGHLDTTFKNSTSTDGKINGMAMQPDGKIVLGGTFKNYGGVTAYKIARINPDGTVDNTFNTGFGFDNDVHEIAVQKDGKILVTGWFKNYNGDAVPSFIRLNNDGRIDSSFHPISLNYSISAIKYLPDNKILVGGRGQVDNDSGYLNKLNENGTIDTSFSQISNPNEVLVNVIIDKENRIIALWRKFSDTDNLNDDPGYIVRYKENGHLDNTFDSSYIMYGTEILNCKKNMVELDNGKILVAPTVYVYNNNHIVYSFDNNGALDKHELDRSAFQNSGNPVITAMLPLSSDSLLILGGFMRYNKTIILRALKININDFKFDGSYNLVTKGGANGDIYDQNIFSNGEILIVGAFTHYNNIMVNHIAKLDRDGNIDDSFHPLTGPDDNVYTACLDNQKILIGGDFTSIDSIRLSKICRLNEDGSVDNSFNSGSGFNNSVYVIVKQADGKYLVGGDFTNYNNQIANRLIRLNSDGSMDNSFNIGNGLDSTVKAIYIQPDGKILIGGSFRKLNNSSTGTIVRINYDGSIDNLNQHFLGSVHCISYDTTHNKFIIGGTNLDGNNTAVYRCNYNGSIDTTLKSPFKPNTVLSAIYSVKILSNNLIVMGGKNGNQEIALFVYKNDSLSTTDHLTEFLNSLLPASINVISEQNKNELIIGGEYGIFATFGRENGGAARFDTYRNNISRIILNVNNDTSTVPIKLLTFEAVPRKNRIVELSWATATEINNKEFIIEHSVDGISFDSIGVVLGAKNSSSIINYQYLDKAPLNGLNYYRLRQKDFNGNYENSKIVSAVIANTLINQIKIYPNPFTTRLNIEGEDPNEIYSLSLLNIEGANFGNFKGNLSSLNNSINTTIGNLPKGIYILVFRSKNILVKSYKVLKL